MLNALRSMRHQGGSRTQNAVQHIEPCVRHAGLQNFAISYCVCFVFTFWIPVLPLRWAADHFVELLSGAIILSISLSITLYAASFRAGTVTAATGISGCPAYDFWMGRELHPRVFGVDLKEFCELYPGLIAWALLNLAFAHKQYDTTGQVRSGYALVCMYLRMTCLRMCIFIRFTYSSLLQQ